MAYTAGLGVAGSPGESDSQAEQTRPPAVPLPSLAVS